MNYEQKMAVWSREITTDSLPIFLRPLRTAEWRTSIFKFTLFHGILGWNQGVSNSSLLHAVLHEFPHCSPEFTLSSSFLSRNVFAKSSSDWQPSGSPCCSSSRVGVWWFVGFSLSGWPVYLLFCLAVWRMVGSRWVLRSDWRVIDDTFRKSHIWSCCTSILILSVRSLCLFCKDGPTTCSGRITLCLPGNRLEITVPVGWTLKTNN